MKTNKFMQFTAAAAVVCGMSVLTSREKDDYELPEAIESEVYDTGASRGNGGVGNGRHQTELRVVDHGEGDHPRQLRQQSFGYLNGELNHQTAVCQINHWAIGDW